jgi:Uma2 family endonuclease
MALPAEKFSLSDYLAWEEIQPERHEFYRGEVFAMVGVRRAHAEISGNLFAALKSHLKGAPCRVYTESVKVQVAHDTIFYPDVFVTCDPADLQTDRIFHNPKLIVEVLSESTEGYNRGLKFTAYRQLASLQEYLLIDPDSRRVEVYRRNERDVFELHDQTGRSALELTCVGLTLAMVDLFDGVDPVFPVVAAPA